MYGHSASKGWHLGLLEGDGLSPVRSFLQNKHAAEVGEKGVESTGIQQISSQGAYAFTAALRALPCLPILPPTLRITEARGSQGQKQDGSQSLALRLAQRRVLTA